jgi:hypothetical protein
MHGTAEWVQSGVAVITTIEFFLYPLSLLLAFFVIEGFVRFAAALISSEVVPSLPVVLGYNIIAAFEKRKALARLRSLPQDQFELLPGERIRISSPHAKLSWTPTTTITISDRWYEVEAEMPSTSPLEWVYLLRPAPAGKILRRLERYDPPQQ